MKWPSLQSNKRNNYALTSKKSLVGLTPGDQNVWGNLVTSENSSDSAALTGWVVNISRSW